MLPLLKINKLWISRLICFGNFGEFIEQTQESKSTKLQRIQQNNKFYSPTHQGIHQLPHDKL